MPNAIRYQGAVMSEKPLLLVDFIANRGSFAPRSKKTPDHLLSQEAT
jgi:hypothetical protein